MSKPRRIYLAGPMRGYLDHNRPAFNQWAGRLRAEGFSVINPAELDAKDQTPKDNYTDYYRRDLPFLAQCDAVVVMPGWQQSTGATLEVTVARILEMPVLELPDLRLMPVEELPAIVHPTPSNN